MTKTRFAIFMGDYAARHGGGLITLRGWADTPEEVRDFCARENYQFDWINILNTETKEGYFDLEDFLYQHKITMED